MDGSIAWLEFTSKYPLALGWMALLDEMGNILRGSQESTCLQINHVLDRGGITHAKPITSNLYI